MNKIGITLTALLITGSLAAPATASAAKTPKAPKLCKYIDSDRDRMVDSWEREMGLKVGKRDAKADPDRDGASNLAEFLRGTDPRKRDR